MVRSGWKDVDDVRALSFDVYGTLIDWRLGLRNALEEEGLLEQITEPLDGFLARREAKEAELEAAPYRYYREILATSIQSALRDREVRIDDRASLRLADSLKDWPPFPDTVSALRRLGSYWPLCLVSNIDRAPLQKCAARLGIPFAEVVTAEDVRSYKPAPAHFEELRRRLGARAAGLLHVAGSVFHDLEPAARAGIPCVWVNRTGEKLPSGLAPRFVTRNLLELCVHLGV